MNFGPVPFGAGPKYFLTKQGELCIAECIVRKLTRVFLYL
jgi:hypothetical protein